MTITAESIAKFVSIKHKESKRGYEDIFTLGANSLAPALLLAVKALEVVACAQIQDVIRNECPAEMIDKGYIREAQQALAEIEKMLENK